MKKLFAIAAVVAVALTSCVENEVVTPAGEIAFKDYTLSSKALILPGSTAKEALPEDCAFGAFALYTGKYETSDTDAAPDAIYVDDLRVSHDDATDQWAYDVAQYWPTDQENDKLDFYAYYPYNASVGEWDAVNNCVRFHGAELGTTLNGQTDWMVTTPVIGRNYSNSTDGVPVVFNHVTSMIVFKAADITPEARYQNLVTINSITVKNAAYKGDFTTIAGTPTWTSVYAGSRTDVVVFNAGQAITTTVADVTKATVDGGALIVVPETIPNGTTFVVNYSIAESADHVIAAVNNKDITINVNTLGNTVWEPGKKYVYTINFDLIGGINEGLHEITFVPTVSPWDEVAGGSYEI